MCHIHAEGRDHITAGRFTVRLWPSGKVRDLQLLINGKLLNERAQGINQKTWTLIFVSKHFSTRGSGLLYLLLWGQPGYPGVAGLMNHKQEQMASS